ncbi:cytochrome P450 [Archangium lipolyticum]|uniref:cytochrome P450 n=1 Tax=Archangium lipolyticum TaxID=2970465 RepID=UPI00214A13C0|nr:cytochrome P450 [Archangium lipolyticum]
MSSAAAPSDLNPVSPENLSDPLPLYRELRERAPVYWSEPIHSWLVTRHEDVVAGFRDPRLSANRTVFFEHQVQSLGPDSVSAFMRVIRDQMFMKDGSEHIRLRRNINPGFTAQSLDTWRPAIRRTMEQLLERVMPRGRMDLVKEISYELPPLVIAELLGIPAEDRERFRAWSKPMADFSSPAPDADMRVLAHEVNRATMAFREYLMAVVEERRRAPGRDVLSQMVSAEEDGKLSTEEVVANAILLVFAGHTTTTDQLSNAVYDLLTHPEQLQALRGNPALLGQTLEECIRFSPAVPGIGRVAVEDFELRGQKIRKGSHVMFLLAAANRDPEVFSQPDRFDISRDSAQTRHLSFGFGPHQCIGSGLARRELEIALELLFQRLPGLRLDEAHTPVRHHSLAFRGFSSLHVRW